MRAARPFFRACRVSKGGFSSCLGGDGSLPIANPRERSFLVASSPLWIPKHHDWAPGRRGCPLVMSLVVLWRCCGEPAQAVIRDYALRLPWARPSATRSCCHDQELPADSGGSRGVDVLPDFCSETCLRRAAAALRGGGGGAGGRDCLVDSRLPVWNRFWVWRWCSLGLAGRPFKLQPAELFVVSGKGSALKTGFRFYFLCV